ncbi:related to TGF beta receptor associated protein 1 [Phialocephala subalpina]|uniref:Related to TGF beta receptor associated protein 1 n=1 Tax=Phialocephala subalpina TaxID=576137 RepID=A0A1L7XM40_9HELO|nr:related to TGF beta receptor associated protein 1 [Phialocephala subalpina]
METQDVETTSSRKTRCAAPETGPFVLRSLLQDLPLSAEGDRDDIEINCVEFLDQNLYIGTSASEILHFVQIPPDPEDASGRPSYILASRLPPAFHEPPTPARPGVQQILLLPKVNKACILCNWTVTFYSLPELSPVFGNTQIRPCNWIGGIDLNTDIKEGNSNDGRSPSVTVLASLNKKIRVIKISEDPRALRTIDFAGSTISVRRDSFACVADSRSYALLDVDRLLKIPLFPISSLDNSQSGSIGGHVEDISGNASGGISRSTSSAQGYSSGLQDDRGHSRSTSLGAMISAQYGRHGRGPSGDHSGRETPDGLFREASPAPAVSPRGPIPREPSPAGDKPLPPPPGEATTTEQMPPPPPAPEPVYLKPHVVSPSPQEFLLVTGTGPNDPGVGMFVNLEGDVTRSTLEFDRYPEQVVADGRGLGIDPTPLNIEDEEEGFILASMTRDCDEGACHGIEIQRWDLDPGEGEMEKYWLKTPGAQEKTSRIGLRSVVDVGDIFFDDVVDKLRLKRFQPFATRSMDDSILSLHSVDSRTAMSLERVSGERQLFESGESLPEGWEEHRNEEELQFAQRLGHARTRVVAWSGKDIWWAVRNPMALRLDASISDMAESKIQDDKTYPSLDRKKLVELINSLRGREAKTETEFLSLGYIRQRAGLLLFMSGLDVLADPPSEPEYRIAEDALLEGGLDPRVILAILPYLRNEIIEGRNGIWVHGGVKGVADSFITNSSTGKAGPQQDSVISDHLLHFLRRFLAAWRKKKGFGSIANEKEVFRSVDAALLIVLLQLDRSTPAGVPRGRSVRVELYDLVDNGVDCFERAISLLESYNRLYVLSRLYQSRKMAGEVLASWRRIVEGELDEGGELRDGEQRVREYLAKIRNATLVQEYGVWLAARNPKLGVQVFAEDRSLVKFEPTQVVEILRTGAPSAVKDYLEYLVFNKNHAEYINELIAYYLDIVTDKLEESKEARSILAQTYESYRALRPPKPTYRQFITDNALEEEWWHSRLRLLQLLGGSQGSASQYDVAAILQRIAPYTKELVPEVIILDGRQSHHEEALRLLTHGLGDYDTAINYCLLGGSSIYHPISGTVARESLPTREQQAKLFGFLLSEFLKIEDISNRVEQTSNLLERFGGWFDVGHVLSLIPDTWSVELVSGFLVSALRRIVRERSETMVAKALSSAENLKVSADLIGKIDAAGPSVEA